MLQMTNISGPRRDVVAKALLQKQKLEDQSPKYDKNTYLFRLTLPTLMLTTK